MRRLLKLIVLLLLLSLSFLSVRNSQWQGLAGLHSVVTERTFLRAFDRDNGRRHNILKRWHQSIGGQFEWQRRGTCARQQSQPGRSGPGGDDCQREDNRCIRQLQEVACSAGGWMMCCCCCYSAVLILIGRLLACLAVVLLSDDDPGGKIPELPCS